MIDTRVKRFVLGFIVLVAVLCLAAVCALFVWVNEKAVQRTIEDFSAQALSADVRFEGPVKIQRLSTLKIALPAMTFTDRESGALIGRIASAHADVSIWSLALGAVHVHSAEIDGLEGTLSVPALSGNALFESTFGSVRFPDSLRVSSLNLTRARFTLEVAAHERAQRFLLTDLSLSLGRFSPEMTTPFELSTRLEALDESGRVVPMPELEMPAADPAEPAGAADAGAEPAAPAAESAPQESSEASEKPSAEAPSGPSADTSAGASSDNQAEAAQGRESAAGESSAEAAMDAGAPAEPVQGETAGPESAPAAEAPADAGAPEAHGDAALPESAPAQPAAGDAAAPAILSWLGAAHAQSLPEGSGESAAGAADSAATPAQSIFEGFDPSRLSAMLSAKGTLTISTANRYVLFENLSFSGEVFYGGEVFTTVARADVLRFKGEELSGMNASLSLSRPQQSSGDMQFAAADFRLRPGVLESPEMRFEHSRTEDGRTTSLSLASTVTADLKSGAIDCDSFTARVTVTGDKTLPSDFEVSLSGFVRARLAQREARVGLSGSFAGAPVSYNGDIVLTDIARLRGDLMLGDLDTARLPAIQNLDWLQQLDFTGTLRIANITSGPFTATQLHAQLTAGEGRLHLSDLIVNVADGRVLGELALASTGDWVFEGRVDGSGLDKLMAGLGASPLISGVASGPLVISGRRLDAASLEASCSLSVLRGAYHGLDLEAARRVVLKTAPESDITRPGARTAFDEASAQLSLKNRTLTIGSISARSVYLKSTGSVRADLAAGTVEGSMKSTFAPLHGEPAIYLSAELSGSGLAPAWTFDFARSGQALSRAQGRPLLKPGRPAQEGAQDKPAESRSLWQSVRDFFKF